MKVNTRERTEMKYRWALMIAKCGQKRWMRHDCTCEKINKDMIYNRFLPTVITYTVRICRNWPSRCGVQTFRFNKKPTARRSVAKPTFSCSIIASAAIHQWGSRLCPHPWPSAAPGRVWQTSPRQPSCKDAGTRTFSSCKQLTICCQHGRIKQSNMIQPASPSLYEQPCGALGELFASCGLRDFSGLRLVFVVCV